MKPFIISALVSGVAMGMLWFYFDYCAEAFENSPKPNGYSYLGHPPDHQLHWTLLFLPIPPLAFIWALSKVFKKEENNKPWVWLIMGSVILWLISWIVGVDMNTGLLHVPFDVRLRRPYEGPYYSNLGIFAITHIVLVYSLIRFLRRRGIEKLPRPDSSKVSLGFYLPFMLIYFLFPYLSNIPFYINIEKTLFLPYSMQIFWSVIFVTCWQLLFGLFLIHWANKKDEDDQIAQIGR